MAKNRSTSSQDRIRNAASKLGVPVQGVNEVDLGIELMYVCSVAPEDYEKAIDVRLELQAQLNQETSEDNVKRSIVFREGEQQVELTESAGHGLQSPEAMNLRSLIETRSRTSLAVPSLQYQEDPRASMQVVSSPKSMVVSGRRGVGKTALLGQVHTRVKSMGNAAVWINCQTYRDLPVHVAAAHALKNIFEELTHFGDEKFIGKSEDFQEQLTRVILDEISLEPLIPEINKYLMSRFGSGNHSLFVFLDDFYMLNIDHQPKLLDFLFRSIRDCSAALKIATVGNLTRLFDFDLQLGLQVPHDASRLNLDQTLEDPKSTQAFLESVLRPYIEQSGYGTLAKIMNPAARGRLVLASGGVPRDYLTILSLAMDKAIKKTERAVQVTAESVNAAAGEFAEIRRSDLEADIKSLRVTDGHRILEDAKTLYSEVREQASSTYFRVDRNNVSRDVEERLGRLIDLRMIHLVWKGFSDKKGMGNVYDAYTLNLADFSESRLFRNLELLDIESGSWFKRRTGRSRDRTRLNSNALRSELLRAPLVAEL